MSPAIEAAALAVSTFLFNSLWQGALIAGTAWLALRCLPRLGASTRHAVWLCALAALAIVPLATVALGGRHAAPPPFTIPAHAGTPQHAATAAAPVRARPEFRGATAPALVPAGAIDAAPTAEAPAADAPAAHITLPFGLAITIFVAWLLFAGARVLRLIHGFCRLAQIRRSASCWSRAYAYPVLLSRRVGVPVALGMRHPAVVLPAGLPGELDAGALEAVIAHEVAHLLRGDVWTNAIARVIEALAAFNPAAWFIVRALSTEREIACDDRVVARTGSGDALAAVLARLACGARAIVPIAAPSALGSRHSIVLRIERLLDGRPRRVALSRSALGAVVAALAIVAACAQSVSPVLAYGEPPRVLAAAPAKLPGGGCFMPNRGIAFAARPRPGSSQSALPLSRYFLRPASALVAKYGAANVVTFDLTVGADGLPRAAKVVSEPYAGAGKNAMLMLMHGRYQPLLRNCVPVATTIRSGVRLGETYQNSLSTVAPVYPGGWSAQHPGACKVPVLLRSGMPAYPAAAAGLPLATEYDASVRVHVDAAGHPANAVVVTSSGKPAFDRALLDAARSATYPLTEASGFKQVRPSGTTIAWNAAHGSQTYVACTPRPSDYVWNTSFSRNRSFLLTDMNLKVRN